MTDREKAIVQAYTGVVMLAGEKFDLFYKYLEELYDRPVYTHEIPFLDIKEKATPDFLKLCEEDTPSTDDWSRYSTALWREAYERGKRDAQPEVAKDMNVPSTDCISRQAAIDEILGQPPEPHYPSWYAEQIKRLPSAQPERMKGHWIEIQAPDSDGNGLYECSVCHRGEVHVPIVEVPFCWHCGAQMTEG